MIKRNLFLVVRFLGDDIMSFVLEGFEGRLCDSEDLNRLHGAAGECLNTMYEQEISTSDFIILDFKFLEQPE